MGHILSEQGGGEWSGGRTHLPWEVGGWRSEVAAAFSGFKACCRLEVCRVTVDSSAPVRADVSLWDAVMASAIKH